MSCQQVTVLLQNTTLFIWTMGFVRYRPMKKRGGASIHPETPSSQRHIRHLIDAADYEWG